MNNKNLLSCGQKKKTDLSRRLQTIGTETLNKIISTFNTLNEKDTNVIYLNIFSNQADKKIMIGNLRTSPSNARRLSNRKVS